MPKEPRVYPDMAPPMGPYAHSVRVDHLLFISGCTARGTDAEHGDVAAQTAATLDKVRRILEKDGLNLEALVKVSFYLTEMERANDVQNVRRRYFSDPKQYPASLMVGVKALAEPHLKVEIDGIARLPNPAEG